MDVRKLALLFGALMIAAVTAVMAKNMFTGASAPEASAAPVVPAGPEVLVATRALPVGTIIDAEAFRFQPWPQGLVQDQYYVRGRPNADPSSLIGTVVRTEISAGQPVTRGAVIRPGERGYLAAALGPGMRAVTVAVSETSGVAGFVFPGDRVDLVLTQEVGAGGEGSPLRVSETIIRNIRVLAVDQRINARDENGNQVARNVSTVTFEATPKIAEKIAVAQRIGSLSLSLRSLADNTAELERAIASGEVQVPQTDDPRAERRMLLAIANQPIDSNTTYTLGSDVSRFERGTVPRRAPQQANNNNTAAPAPVPAAPAASGETRPIGPVVRIARGNNVTLVPVGAR
ncbi:MAG: Flp pilus assembly protein CpaB [Pseudomonadota bacterium]|nr:Flp pilus assembly protein CpaB [Pseudomonadota bacterium]